MNPFHDFVDAAKRCEIDLFTSETSAVNMYTLEGLKHAREMIVHHGQNMPCQRKGRVGERRTICECRVRQ